jgi:hypothetical protein
LAQVHVAPANKLAFPVHPVTIASNLAPLQVEHVVIAILTDSGGVDVSSVVAGADSTRDVRR